MQKEQHPCLHLALVGCTFADLRVAEQITVVFDASILPSYFLIFFLNSTTIRVKNE
jgi:hypothetical protein